MIWWEKPESQFLKPSGSRNGTLCTFRERWLGRFSSKVPTTHQKKIGTIMPLLCSWAQLILPQLILNRKRRLMSQLIIQWVIWQMRQRRPSCPLWATLGNEVHSLSREPLTSWKSWNLQPRRRGFSGLNQQLRPLKIRKLSENFPL
jgi:hypothetical protein